jgi:hypothetical protein
MPVPTTGCFSWSDLNPDSGQGTGAPLAVVSIFHESREKGMNVLVVNKA